MPPIPSFSAPQSFLYCTFPVSLCSSLSDNDTSWPLVMRQLYTLVYVFLLHRYYGNSFFILPVRPVQDTRAFSSPPPTSLLQPPSHSLKPRTSSVVRCVYPSSPPTRCGGHCIASRFSPLIMTW